ncbi:MAG TPA: sigma-70 family RNA polymerase sigma factor [Alphaproteobacteria bacterium]
MSGLRNTEEVKWLIAREIPRLRRYALVLTGEPDAADDLVQDCVERAIRKRHLWRRRGSIRAWLYRILYNVFANQKTRRHRARRQVPLDEMAVAPVEAPRQEHRLACRDIADAMRMLPDDQRAAIALTVLEDLSYDEAAAALDIPIGTLRSRLSRGRERLRELYVQPGDPVRLRRVK